MSSHSETNSARPGECVAGKGKTMTVANYDNFGMRAHNQKKRCSSMAEIMKSNAIKPGFGQLSQRCLCVGMCAYPVKTKERASLFFYDDKGVGFWDHNIPALLFPLAPGTKRGPI